MNEKQLSGEIGQILDNFQPVARVRLLRSIANAVRKQNLSNIRAQRAADGKKWEPKKRNPRAKMMWGLGKTRNLKIAARADRVVLAHTGMGSRLAAIHHHGLIEKGSRYPERPILGIPDNLEQIASDVITKALIGGVR